MDGTRKYVWSPGFRKGARIFYLVRGSLLVVRCSLLERPATKNQQPTTVPTRLLNRSAGRGFSLLGMRVKALKPERTAQGDRERLPPGVSGMVTLTNSDEVDGRRALPKWAPVRAT